MMSNYGISLIELVVCIVILGLLFIPAYEFLNQGILSWQTGDIQSEVVQNARVALERIKTEARHTREIYTANLSEFYFWWRDLDDDEIADNNEKIRYYWDGTVGGELTRQMDSEATPTALANYVQDFQLQYWELSGESLVPWTSGDLSAIELVTFSLKIGRSGKDYSFITQLRGSISARNM